MDQNKEFVFKVLLVGDAGVGKSSILANYVRNEFKNDYTVTIGVEFGSKTLEIDSQNKVKLQIWDTAGQESFRSIVRSFYRNTSGVFVTYSICNRDTFLNLDKWIHELKENANENTVITLVGNKADKIEDRQVTHEEAENYAKVNGLDFFFETSAFTGENIDKCFYDTTKLIFKNYLKTNTNQQNNLFDGQPSLNLSENKKGYSRLSSKTFRDKNHSKHKEGCC